MYTQVLFSFNSFLKENSRKKIISRIIVIFQIIKVLRV